MLFTSNRLSADQCRLCCVNARFFLDLASERYFPLQQPRPIDGPQPACADCGAGAGIAVDAGSRPVFLKSWLQRLCPGATPGELDGGVARREVSLQAHQLVRQGCQSVRACSRPGKFASPSYSAPCTGSTCKEQGLGGRGDEVEVPAAKLAMPQLTCATRLLVVRCRTTWPSGLAARMRPSMHVL